MPAKKEMATLKWYEEYDLICVTCLFMFKDIHIIYIVYTEVHQSINSGYLRLHLLINLMFLD